MLRHMLETFRPLLEAAAGLALDNPEHTRAALAQRFDPNGPAAQELSAQLVALYEQGRLAENGALPVRYGRVSKASEQSLQFSIDVVVMNGPGPLHRHPKGEINFAIRLDGEPRFDGQPAGWIVFPPNSQHVPTVRGGTMLIVYLLPDGKIEFVR